MQLKHLEMSMFKPNETFKIQPIPIKTLTKNIYLKTCLYHIYLNVHNLIYLLN